VIAHAKPQTVELAHPILTRKRTNTEGEFKWLHGRSQRGPPQSNLPMCQWVSTRRP